jgi:hypothetical protein
MGWMSTSGNRTMLPSVADVAMLVTNSKNCVPRTIEYGIEDSMIPLASLEIEILATAFRRRRRRRMSAEVRTKISAAQKKRWAKQKRSAKD